MEVQSCIQSKSINSVYSLVHFWTKFIQYECKLHFEGSPRACGRHLQNGSFEHNTFNSNTHQVLQTAAPIRLFPLFSENAPPPKFLDLRQALQQQQPMGTDATSRDRSFASASCSLHFQRSGLYTIRLLKPQVENNACWRVRSGWVGLKERFQQSLSNVVFLGHLMFRSLYRSLPIVLSKQNN